MKTWVALIVLVGVPLVFRSSSPSRADDKSGSAEDDQGARIKEVLEQAVDWYDVLSDTEAKTSLHPQIVLRWQNAERVQTGAALMVLWTDHGRPEAMASIFQWERDICHEFGSLSRSHHLEARDKTAAVWSPAKAGVEFRDVPEAPAPADNPAARLRQLKSIAERFTARLPDRNGENKYEVLRLLPRALYRYDLKDSKGADPSLRDGGMFAFVMGTDPEAILLLEAVTRDEKPVWQYAFARATGFAVEASLGNDVVWSVSADWGNRDRKSTQVQIRRPLP
jgi:hypothetical protein